MQTSWLDPQSVEDKEKFFYRYTVAWGFAKAAQEIINWIDLQVSERDRLRKKAEGKDPEPGFGIGR